MDPLERVMIFKVRQKRIVKKKPAPSKEYTEINNIRSIMRIIKRGDFNPEYVHHNTSLALAIRKGYVDKDLNLLKDLPLTLAQRKRMAQS